MKQSVVPPDDVRIPYAMEAHGVAVRAARGRACTPPSCTCARRRPAPSLPRPTSLTSPVSPHALPTPFAHPQGVKIPLEPRHVAQYAAFDDAPAKGPLWRFLSGLAGGGRGGEIEPEAPGARRGPRLAPSAEEIIATLPQDLRDQVCCVGGGGVGGGEVGGRALRRLLLRSPRTCGTGWQGLAAVCEAHLLLGRRGARWAPCQKSAGTTRATRPCLPRLAGHR